MIDGLDGKQDWCLWPELLEALLAAHTKWIETTQLFVNLLTSREQAGATPTATATAAAAAAAADDDDDADCYPAGKLMDLATLGRLNIRIKQLVTKWPAKALDTFQSSATFRRMDAGLRSAVSAKCSR